MALGRSLPALPADNPFARAVDSRELPPKKSEVHPVPRAMPSAPAPLMTHYPSQSFVTEAPVVPRHVATPSQAEDVVRHPLAPQAMRCALLCHAALSSTPYFYTKNFKIINTIRD